MGAALSVLTPHALIIGASGAIFGVFFGFAYYWPRAQIYIWGILPVEARVLVVAVTAMSLWAGFMGGSGGVAHFAHLGGFAGGVLYLKLRERFSAGAQFRAVAKAPAPKAAAGADLARWRSMRNTGDLHPLNRGEIGPDPRQDLRVRGAEPDRQRAGVPRAVQSASLTRSGSGGIRSTTPRALHACSAGFDSRRGAEYRSPVATRHPTRG